MDDGRAYVVVDEVVAAVAHGRVWLQRLGCRHGGAAHAHAQLLQQCRVGVLEGLRIDVILVRRLRLLDLSRTPVQIGAHNTAVDIVVAGLLLVEQLRGRTAARAGSWQRPLVWLRVALGGRRERLQLRLGFDGFDGRCGYCLFLARSSKCRKALCLRGPGTAMCVCGRARGFEGNNPQQRRAQEGRYRGMQRIMVQQRASLAQGRAHTVRARANARAEEILSSALLSLSLSVAGSVPSDHGRTHPGKLSRASDFAERMRARKAQASSSQSSPAVSAVDKAQASSLRQGKAQGRGLQLRCVCFRKTKLRVPQTLRPPSHLWLLQSSRHSFAPSAASIAPSSQLHCLAAPHPSLPTCFLLPLALRCVAPPTISSPSRPVFAPPPPGRAYPRALQMLFWVSQRPSRPTATPRRSTWVSAPTVTTRASRTCCPR
ncbi:hypothetical protein B5807_05177 [Epicoccum nigrum]|uniref:Uncharacterized protein n=1 Tax=Epicoccum nigrum TaxID=105696 RepID=A0A1Y2M4R2_EPING|nr:hypothetical protein B5807_05177 [Epicoccum nigrum]